MFLVLALVLLVLTAGFAEGSTWTNPNDLLFGTLFPIPRSMVSAVSNGVYYDEIDTIILSPAELSNYSGFTIFTGYGNYEYDYTSSGVSPYVTTFLNPFTDAGIAPGGNTGSYTLGLTGELFDIRGGVIAGFEFLQDNNMNGTAAGAVYENSESTTVDADADGTADFTYTNTESYTDYDVENTVRFGAGVDLDFIGASIYSIFHTNTRTIGGNYTYTRPLTADADQTDPNDVVTSKVVTYGYGEDGKPAWDPDNNYTNWLLGVRGHLPLEIADISMPVKVDLNFGSMNDSLIAGYDPKRTDTYTATNLTGFTDATEVNTITAVYGENDVANPWDPNNESGVLAANPTYDEAAFRLLASNVETAAVGYGYALDPENFSDFNFVAGLEGLIDPEIVVNDVFSVKTRGQLGYMLDITSQNNAGIRSVSYTEAEETSDSDSSYSYSQSITAPRTYYDNILDIELGGIMDLHNKENTLSVACGLFYHPTITLEADRRGNQVVTTSESWTDESTTPDPEVAAWGAAIGPGTAQGVYNSVATTTYQDGKWEDTNTFEHNLYIPVSTRVRFANGALELIGGYLLQHTTTTTITTDYSSFADTNTVTTLTDSAGAAITAPADDSVAVPTAGTEVVTSKTDSNGWDGMMSFMLRWNAMPGMTVDFFGESILDALDFDIFGDDTNTTGPGTIDGFNPANFIESLGISVTISAK